MTPGGAEGDRAQRRCSAMEPARAVSVRSWTAPTALVIGGDAEVRERVAALVADAGFGVVSGPPSQPAAPGPAPRSLVVLIGAAAQLPLLRDVRRAGERHPGARILVVMPADARHALSRRVILAGATGIVGADDVDEALVPTARAILAGQLTVPAALSRQVAPQPLSHREKQIMALIVEGLTNQEIGARLFLAESTVKTHVSSAFRKLDARSRAEAVARMQDPDAALGVPVADAAR